MPFATSASFEAPPEILFDTLLDPVGMSRWLPHDVAMNPVGAGLLEVVQTAGPGNLDGDRQNIAAEDRFELTYLKAPEAGFIVRATVAPARCRRLPRGRHRRAAELCRRPHRAPRGRRAAGPAP
jgi:uncharacterized protein YndB with AHSA1/START domain